MYETLTENNVQCASGGKIVHLQHKQVNHAKQHPMGLPTITNTPTSTPCTHTIPRVPTTHLQPHTTPPILHLQPHQSSTHVCNSSIRATPPHLHPGTTSTHLTPPHMQHLHPRHTYTHATPTPTPHLHPCHTYTYASPTPTPHLHPRHTSNHTTSPPTLHLHPHHNSSHATPPLTKHFHPLHTSTHGTHPMQHLHPRHTCVSCVEVLRGMCCMGGGVVWDVLHGWRCGVGGGVL